MLAWIAREHVIVLGVLSFLAIIWSATSSNLPKTLPELQKNRVLLIALIIGIYSLVVIVLNNNLVRMR